MTLAKRLSSITGLMLVLLLAIWLRAPFIGTGLPYFYDEDEAHHFNRTVEMVQRRDFNPHYFLKPALHFYLRMPVVLAYAKLKGISSNEIKTRDPYGIAKYAFSASHPGAVKAVRSLSLLFSLTIILFSYLLTAKISDSELAPILVAAVLALSPALIAHSSLVAVDTMMAGFCLISVYFSSRLSEQFSWSDFALASITAGMAVATKYNAAPIFIPLALASFNSSRQGLKMSFAALALATATFCALNPYIFIEYNLFLTHVTYEIKHYAVLGHEGHSSERGLSQIIFYSKWLADEGLGVVAAVTGLFGLCYLSWRAFKNHEPTWQAMFSFPLAYFLMMILQKTNFTRNMLVFVPFAAIAFVVVAENISPKKHKSLGALLLFLFAVSFEFPSALQTRLSAQDIPESRTSLQNWLGEQSLDGSNVALSGELQISPDTYRYRGIDRFNPALVSPLDLYLSGFDYVVYGPGQTGDLSNLELVKSIDGNLEAMRIVKNPAIKIFSFKAGELLKANAEEKLSAADYKPLQFDLSKNRKSELPCRVGQDLKPREQEGHCWTEKRIEKIKLINLPAVKGEKIRVEIEAQSPWANQTLTLRIGKWSQSKSINTKGYALFSFELPSDMLTNQGELLAEVAKTKSPARELIGQDKRKLGVAIKSITLG